MSGPQRYNCTNGCLRAQPGPTPRPGNDKSISAAVGLGGRNMPSDVRTVQELLNNVPPDAGGPAPKLVVDGLCGPLTRAAIAKFQQKQLGFSDSRVDPGGPTLQRLNRFRKGPSATSIVLGPGSPTNAMRDAIRMTTAQAAFPDIIAACRRAEQTASAAADFKMLGPGALTVNPEPFRFIDRHFKFGDQDTPRTIAELRFIEVTFRRMRTVAQGRRSSTGTQGFGASILEIDPKPEETEKLRRGVNKVSAYVPIESVEHTDGTTPLRIYLCEGLDGRPPDYYVRLLTHELAHFVDDEHESTVITDHGNAFDGSVMRLNHHDRMHNAETYALFAFERAFGAARLLAIHPNLAPMVK
jgi:hypothetical protein